MPSVNFSPTLVGRLVAMPTTPIRARRYIRLSYALRWRHSSSQLSIASGLSDMREKMEHTAIISVKYPTM